jgi:hypothetical protein
MLPPGAAGDAGQSADRAEERVETTVLTGFPQRRLAKSLESADAVARECSILDKGAMSATYNTRPMSG